MADKKTVLVFPAGTEIAFEIHAALCRSKFVRLIGGTSVPCHAEFVFETCVEGFPFADDPALVDFMNRVIDDYGVDYIFPAHDSTLLALSEARERLHATVIAPAKETVAICRDKNKTYAYLAGADYLPGFYDSADAVPSYPIFIKPAVGQGSQGARKIESREALDEALSDGVAGVDTVLPEPCGGQQRRIPGKVTVDLLVGGLQDIDADRGLPGHVSRLVCDGVDKGVFAHLVLPGRVDDAAVLGQLNVSAPGRLHDGDRQGGTLRIF